MPSFMPRAPLAAVAATLLLGACQHQKPVDAPMAPTNIQRGDTMLLAVPLAWPQGAQEIVFQNERIVPRPAVARDVPYCALSPVGNAPRSLAPGPLTVREVVYDERGTSGPGGTNSVTRVTMARAEAAYAMNCGWPAGSRAGSFVSIGQIFNAVGSAFSLGAPK
jgi:hypothetical protein